MLSISYQVQWELINNSFPFLQPSYIFHYLLLSHTYSGESKGYPIKRTRLFQRRALHFHPLLSHHICPGIVASSQHLCHVYLWADWHSHIWWKCVLQSSVLHLLPDSQPLSCGNSNRICLWRPHRRWSAFTSYPRNSLLYLLWLERCHKGNLYFFSTKNLTTYILKI